MRRLADKGCHAVTFSENPAGLGMPSIHTDRVGPAVRGVLRHTARCCAATSARRRRRRRTSPDAPPPVPMNLSSAMAIYTLGDLLWADFWHRFPDAAVLAHRGRHRLDPVLPLAGRAHARPPQRRGCRHELPQGLRPTELFHERILVLLHQRPHRGEAARRVQHRQRVLGVRLPALRQLVAGRAREAAGAASSDLARRPSSTTSRTATRCATTSSTRSRSARPSSAPPRALRAEATDVDTVTHVGRLADETDRNAWRQMTGAAAAGAGAKR